MWAVSTKSEITFPGLSDYDKELVISQLDNLVQQSQYAPDGWGLITYNVGESFTPGLLHRSEIPAYLDTVNFWSTADYLLEDGAGRLAIGHLRIASSGAIGIPNPHPWLFNDTLTYSLVHNGTLNKNILYDLLTGSGSDLSWLENYPPQTFGAGAWQDSSGWENVVDSELILLFIMKQIENRGTVIDGLQEALSSLLSSGVSSGQLNIIFSDGQSLFIFGGNNGLSVAETESHTAIMTTPPNQGVSGNLDWRGIDHGELLIVNSDGIISYPDFASIKTDVQPLYPNRSWLLPAYPNPFNGSVTINFDITDAQRPILKIHDILGETVYRKEIFKLREESKSIEWTPKKLNGQLLSTGTYLIQIQADNGFDHQKILFIK